MIGARVLRHEDEDLVHGRAVFVDDLHLPDTLHVAFHRSEVAHARLLEVETGDARSSPGVAGVYTVDDIRQLGEMRVDQRARASLFNPSRPLLADAVVRFAGEAIAAVVADSRYAAEDAAEQVWVEYDELAPVVDVDEAAAPDAPPIHEHGSNVFAEVAYESGAVDESFERADVVVERTLTMPRLTAAPLEPRGVLARPGDGGGVEVWTSSQAAHIVQRAICQAIGLGPASVRVRIPYVGGGFGQKASAYPEEVIVAWLALQHQRPVKWIEDRRENLLAGHQGRGQRIRVRAAASADGTLMALDADVLSDIGAYAVWPQGHVGETGGTASLLPGPYRIPAVRVRSRGVATNKPPCGPYRGVGMVSAVIAHEAAIDSVARAAGVDRLEIRRRNLLHPADLPHTGPGGHTYDSGDYPAALEHIAACAAELDRSRAAAEAAGLRFGVGVSIFVEWTGNGSTVYRDRGFTEGEGPRGYDDVRVTLDEAGTASVWTSLPAIGQGVNTTFAQIVASELSIPVEDVRIELVDTAAVADGNGTFASRSAVSGGGALIKASRKLAEALIEVAAPMLAVPATELCLRDAAVAERSGTRAVPIAQVILQDPGRFHVTARHDPERPTYSYGAHVCAATVDPGTGQAALAGYAVVEDCGRVINPMIVDGQVRGALAQGIGAALLERAAYNDDGQPLATSFMDYLIPTAADVPHTTVEHLEHPAPEGLGGFKGAGESGAIGAPAAVLSAVSDAVGTELGALPLAPETLLRALHDKEAVPR